jgi:sugar O-acyltransferase (sialic acid O-acetyltransferase NeuD family)
VLTVAIFGGAGAAAIVAESVAASLPGPAKLQVLGFLNDVLPRGALVSGLPILGPFAAWRDLPGDTLFMAPLHKAGAMAERATIVESLGIPTDRWATVIDPRSAVASDAIIGPGCFVGPFATVGPGAYLGSHTVVRAGAHVSHDCRLGGFVFVGSNAVISGFCRVADGAYIAPGSTIRDHCSVGGFALVGLGSVVTKDVPDRTFVVGSPARRPAAGG